MPRDGGSAHGYDDAMTEQLLGVAADVLRSFGSAFGGKHLAIVGGAVPSLLVPIPPRGVEHHVGTADLDFHLALHLMDGETEDYYDAIIDGLRELGLRAANKDGREIKWRWIGQYRNIALQVEFLCPVRKTAGRPEDPAQGTPAEANIGPRGEITALAVGYGYLVPDDTEMVERRVEASGGSLSFEFPVAGITSWLCLKADAIMRRDKPKDSYDVVWLINAFGPAEAARRVAESPLLAGENADEVRAQLTRLIGDQFRDVDSIGPRAYAEFLGAELIERRQAVGTFTAFGAELAQRGVVR